MRAVLLPVLAVGFVSGCEAANEATNSVARGQAKTVVNGVVEERFPGVNAAPVTDCIIDAASAREIVQVASASVTGVTQSTVEQVLTIAQRPQAVECIATNSVSLLAL